LTDYIFLVLLILHIGAIVAWMGAGIVFVSVLGPSMQAMTPAGRTEFFLNVLPRYMRYILFTSIASIVFGVLLYGYSVMPSSTVAPSSSGLIWIQAGAGLGVIAFIVVVGYLWPLSKKLVKSAKGEAQNTDGLKIAQSMRAGGAIAALLLAIVLVLMITGTAI
jgi:uncharacterized membrane protein